MSTMEEASWYQMMGISKLLLRNFIIGSFMILLITVAILAKLLSLSQNERRQDEIEHRQELVKCKEDSQKISEDKNTEYKELFRQTIENQYKTQAEFNKWKQLYQSNRK